MALDRGVFFSTIEHDGLFAGGLTKAQRNGIDTILDYWDSRPDLTDLRWLACYLGTPHHETARKMQPVIETCGPRETTNPSVDTAIARLERAFAGGKMPWVKRRYWAKDAKGLSWLGRGLPQVTHYPNYLKAEQKTGHKFTSDPAIMLQTGPAVEVMFKAMQEGWFTGKKLRDFFAGTKCDWRGSRRIINGTESADKVAAYCKLYYSALTLADKGQEHKPAPPKVSDKIEEHATTAATTTAAVETGLHLFGYTVPWPVVIVSVMVVVAIVGWVAWRNRDRIIEMANAKMKGQANG